MRKVLPLPSAEALNQHLTYDPKTGKLFWKVRARNQFTTQGGWLRFNKRHAGKEAGHRHSQQNGKPHAVVIRISIDLVDMWLLAHRVIYAMMGVPIPEGMEIDHRNGNPWDNRWANLRIATSGQNCANTIGGKRIIGGGLPKGVSPQAGRFKAQICFRGHKQHIGMYATPEEAAEAYQRKAAELQGRFASHLSRN